MHRTRVIIAGVQEAETARFVAEAGADGVGLVFVPGSPHYIEPEDGFDVISALPPLVASAGIFADTTVDDFADIEQLCPTSLTIFAGDEDVETVCGCGPDLVKSVAWTPTLSPRDLVKWTRLDEVSGVLLNLRNEPGRSDQQAVDLTNLMPTLEPLMRSISKPILLAGGLTPENVGEVVRALRPYAVMVCRGVESSAGVIDPHKVEAFCAAARHAD